MWDLLENRLRRDGARPLLTCYDHNGARTELSAVTYANWVAKTASMLTDQLDTTVGDQIAMPLLHRYPLHWMSLVWVGAAWTAGLQIVTSPANELVCVTGPDGEVSNSRGDVDDEQETGRFGGQVVTCSLHPLGLGLGAATAPGAIDWASEVRSEPDVFVGTKGASHDLGWDQLTQGELFAIPPVPERVLLDARQPPPDLESVRKALGLALVGPLLGGGSSVVVMSGDPAQIAAAEHALTGGGHSHGGHSHGTHDVPEGGH